MSSDFENFTESSKDKDKDKDDKLDRDIFAMLEGFSDKLGAVEKEVLEPERNANRRRRGAEEKTNSVSLQVKEEIKNIQEEFQSVRRPRLKGKGRSKFKTFLQLLLLLVILALGYHYWTTISTRFSSMHWKSPNKTIDKSNHSWWQRVHGSWSFKAMEGKSNLRSRKEKRIRDDGVKEASKGGVSEIGEKNTNSKKL